MSTRTLLPVTAATLFALCAGSMMLSHHAYSTTASAEALRDDHVLELPTVNVRPDSADLAYYQASQSRRVVDLPAVKVTPDMVDLVYSQAASGAQRVVDLATLTVRPAAADLAWYLSHQAASAGASAISHGADALDAQLAAGASNLIHAAR